MCATRARGNGCGNVNKAKVKGALASAGRWRGWWPTPCAAAMPKGIRLLDGMVVGGGCMGQAADESALQRSWLLTVANICVGNRAALDDAEHSKHHTHKDTHSHTRKHTHTHTCTLHKANMANKQGHAEQQQKQRVHAVSTKAPQSATFSSSCFFEFQSLSNMRNATKMEMTMTMTMAMETTMTKLTTGNKLQRKCIRRRWLL